MIEDLLRPQHLLIILAIAILFFGPQKLPELGKGLGRGIRGFKESLKEVSSDSTVEPKDQSDATSRSA
jgi:sec-independent protein translocase protein TatA